MKSFFMAGSVILLCLLSQPVFAQENPRLAEIQREKQRLEEQAERGRLLIENAQLKYERLVAEEKAAKASEKATKESPPRP